MCVTAVTIFASKNLSSPSRAREFAAERGDLEASDTEARSGSLFQKCRDSVVSSLGTCPREIDRHTDPRT